MSSMKLFFRQAHQLAVRKHGYGCVSRRIRDQSFLPGSSALPRAPRASHRERWAGFTSNLCPPAPNEEIIVPDRVLLDDHVVGAYRDVLQ